MTAGTLTRPPSRPTRGTAGQVHDRIAARRDEIQLVRTRRRRRVLIAVAVVLLLVLGALALTRSPVLQVSRFDIDLGGAEHLSVGQVELVAGIHPHTSMASVDVDVVARRLAALPWVASATVRRVWPHTVAISVVERTAVAQVPSADGGWLLIDEGGHVLERRGQAATGAVRLDVPPSAAAPGSVIDASRGALLLAGRLPADLANELSDLRGGDGDLRATISTGGAVRFCGTDELTAKILALNTMLARVDRAQIGVLDLCVPTAPVLTPPGAGA